MPPTVMISYNSAQRPFAQALKNRLRASGIDVWFDREGVLYETKPFTTDPDWNSMIVQIDAALPGPPAVTV